MEKGATFWVEIRDPKWVAEKQGDSGNSEGYANKYSHANRETSKDPGTYNGQAGRKSCTKTLGVPCGKMLK